MAFADMGNFFEGVLWEVIKSGFIVYSSEIFVALEPETCLSILGVAGAALVACGLTLGTFN